LNSQTQIDMDKVRADPYYRMFREAVRAWLDECLAKAKMSDAGCHGRAGDSGSPDQSTVDCAVRLASGGEDATRSAGEGQCVDVVAGSPVGGRGRPRRCCMNANG